MQQKEELAHICPEFVEMQLHLMDGYEEGENNSIKPTKHSPTTIPPHRYNLQEEIKKKKLNQCCRNYTRFVLRSLIM